MARAGLLTSRWRRVALIVPCATGLAALINLAGCADRLLLHPTTHALPAPGAERTTIAFGGAEVEIFRRPTEAARQTGVRAVVLAFCGNGSRAESDVGRVAARWRQFPVEVWAVNYPGYGGSGGRAALSSIAPVACVAYDAARVAHATRPILVDGNSMGTTAALHLAATRELAGLVLQNPPPLRQLILGRHGWWNLWLIALPVAWSIPGELDSIANASESSAPAIFLTARADELVLPQYQRRVIDAYAGPKRVVELAGGHNSALDEPAQAAWQSEATRLWGWLVGG